MPHKITPSDKGTQGSIASLQRNLHDFAADTRSSHDVQDGPTSAPISLPFTSSKLENEITMLSGARGYNFTSAAQALAYRPAIPLFPDLTSHTSVTIADYGCAGVANSIAPLKEVLSTLSDGSEATIVLNDRTYNDWNEVSRVLKNNLRDLTRGGRIKIFIHMSPVSFFNQVVPSGSVDVGLSFTAFNYLEHILPTPIHPSTDMNVDAKHLTNLQKMQATKKVAQARIDLLKLLRQRAVETKAGGTLITALASCKDHKPEAAGRWSTQPVSAAFQTSLIDAVKKGLLSERQMRAFSFPMHEHHISDVRAAVTEVKDLWRLENLFQQKIIHPAYSSLKDSEGYEAQREEYAEAVTGWVFGVLSWYLVKGMRSTAQARTEASDDLTSMDEQEMQVLDQLRVGMKRSLMRMLQEGWDGETGIEYVYLKLIRN